MLTCLIFAFLRSFSLTLIIILQSLSKFVAYPLVALERTHTASVGTHISRLFACISTMTSVYATPPKYVASPSSRPACEHYPSILSLEFHLWDGAVGVDDDVRGF
jgi:hypothetical protein